MIEPFGAILKQYYPGLRELGFHSVSEESYLHSLVSKNTRIEVSVDKYVSADIVLKFVSSAGQRYPLWQISQLIDMRGYICDKRNLDRIKNHYALRDGAKGPTQFDAGVKIYASTYLEQAQRFLSQYESSIDVDSEDIKLRLPSLEYG